MPQRFRQKIRRGEALALPANADLLDLLFAEPIVANYKAGCATCVTVRGPLEHHMGIADSYEGIAERMRAAFADQTECVILRLDSPGGVVSGLNETVRALRRAADKAGKSVYVYVDEMACSAAYALATIGDVIAMPGSAVVGSIGVISHMLSAAEADKRAGFDWTVITSGDQKADNNEHLPTTSAAKSRERGRVIELAEAFFRLVAEKRPIEAKRARSYQAGTFLGKEGVRAGLADEIMSWDELLLALADEYGIRESTVAQDGTPAEEDMLRLKAMIKRIERALASETNKKKRSALAAQLGAFQATLQAYKKTKHVKETEESEESDDADADAEDDSDDKDDSDAESEESDEDAEGDEADEDAESEESDEDAEGDDDKKDAKKAAKKSSKKPFGKKSAGADEDAESEESDEDAEGDDDKKESKALRSLGLSRGALAALRAKAEAYDRDHVTVATLALDKKRHERRTLIETARIAGRITKAHAAMLANKKLSFVRDFIAMHKKPMVALSEADLAIPGMAQDGSDVSPYMLQQFRAASAASGGKVSVEDLTKAFREAQNGAPAPLGVPGGPPRLSNINSAPVGFPGSIPGVIGRY